MQNVLKLENVCKSFMTKVGEIEVLSDISFEVRPGEILGIIGPSGSGKSTLLNIISGLLKPTSGEIYKTGKVGYMFQRDHLLEWRTIRDNVLLGLEIQKKLENSDNALKMLEKYGLSDFAYNYPKELSGGMRQRIALLRTLAISPELMLLDEPFSALDFQTRLNVCDDVYHMIKNEKISTLLVTHDLSEAIAISDRIVVLSHRPAKILEIIELQLTIDGEKTPLKARSAPEFRQYFDKLWRLLNEVSQDE